MSTKVPVSSSTNPDAVKQFVGMILEEEVEALLTRDATDEDLED